jgi:hypothetical protein
VINASRAKAPAVKQGWLPYYDTEMSSVPAGFVRISPHTSGCVGQTTATQAAVRS